VSAPGPAFVLDALATAGAVGVPGTDVDRACCTAGAPLPPETPFTPTLPVADPGAPVEDADATPATAVVPFVPPGAIALPPPGVAGSPMLPFAAPGVFTPATIESAGATGISTNAGAPDPPFPARPGAPGSGAFGPGGITGETGTGYKTWF